VAVSSTLNFTFHDVTHMPELVKSMIFYHALAGCAAMLRWSASASASRSARSLTSGLFMCKRRGSS
jgi:hypothetical protein